MPDSNAFCGIGKYESGSEDETDIRPGPPSCFRHVPDLENPFHPVIRCHISEPQNPLEPVICKSYGSIMKSKGLAWPKLIPGILIKRYKRFLADVELKNGKAVTAHCPNSGSMTECCAPGSPVYLSHHDNPKRKLKYTWELIKMPTSLVGVNTLVPNRLVFKSVQEGAVKELEDYDSITREVTTGNSRLDILLEKGDEQCFVEIKNCTLVEDGIASFPDAVTSRGLKHLVELQKLVSLGCRGVMFYLIQRTDAKIFKPADSVDPAYGRELRCAADNGVEIIVYDVHIDFKAITLNKKIPYEL